MASYRLQFKNPSTNSYRCVAAAPLEVNLVITFNGLAILFRSTHNIPKINKRDSSVNI